jgi:hypothetical protein
MATIFRKTERHFAPIHRVSLVENCLIPLGTKQISLLYSGGPQDQCSPKYIYTLMLADDRLCRLVVRVPAYRSTGPGFDFRDYQIFLKVVGLEATSQKVACSSPDEVIGFFFN